MKARRAVTLISLTLLAPMLALGAVEEIGLALTLAVEAAGIWLLAADEGIARLGRPARAAVLGLSTLAVVSCVQLIPLPAALLGLVTPRGREIWQLSDAARGIGEQRWHPITLDPPATAFRAATALAAVAMMLALARVAGTSQGRRNILRSVAIAVGLFALAAVAHSLLGLKQPYGLYRYRYPIEDIPIVATMVNPNHVAAVTAVGPPAFLALALDEREQWRPLALLAAVICAVVTVLTHSRSGMIILAFEIVALGLYVLMRARARVRAMALGAGLVLATVGLSAVVARESLRGQLQNRDLSKLDIAFAVGRAAREFWRVGAGRGAMGSAFAAYEGNLGSNVHYLHAENWIAQLAFDIGVPTTLLMVAALLVAVFRAGRAVLESQVRFGAATGLLGMVLHDLADFALEYAGAALIAVALLAIVTGPTTERRVYTETRAVRRRPAIALATGIALLLLWWGHGVEDDLRRVGAEWQRGNIDSKTVLAAIGRHPGEPYLYTAAAVFSAPDRAGPLFHAAARLGPSRAHTHFWFARWFASIGRRPQAYAEYRRTVELSREYVPAVVNDLVRLNAPVFDMVAVFQHVDDVDRLAAALIEQREARLAEQVDLYASETFPAPIRAIERLFFRARAAAQRDKAVAWAQRLIAVAPADERGYALLATAQEGEEAEQTLLRGIAAAGERPALLEALIYRKGVRLGLAAVAAELSRLAAALIAAGESEARFHRVQGDVELARNALASAIAHYGRALTISHDAAPLLVRAAEVAAARGEYATAEIAWSRLVAEFPDHPEYRSGLAAARKLRP